MNDTQHTQTQALGLYKFSKSILDPVRSEPAPLMTQYVSDLLAKYSLQADNPDLDLQLYHPGRNQRLLIASLYEGTIMIARMHLVDT